MDKETEEKLYKELLTGDGITVTQLELLAAKYGVTPTQVWELYNKKVLGYDNS